MDSKKKEANRLINQFIYFLNQTAAYGDTSFFFNMTKMKYEPDSTLKDSTAQTYSVPIEELIPFFEERFPNCKITYEESRKGILIDWS